MTTFHLKAGPHKVMGKIFTENAVDPKDKNLYKYSYKDIKGYGSILLRDINKYSSIAVQVNHFGLYQKVLKDIQ